MHDNLLLIASLLSCTPLYIYNGVIIREHARIKKFISMINISHISIKLYKISHIIIAYAYLMLLNSTGKGTFLMLASRSLHSLLKRLIFVIEINYCRQK